MGAVCESFDSLVFKVVPCDHALLGVWKAFEAAGEKAESFVLFGWGRFLVGFGVCNEGLEGFFRKQGAALILT